MKIIYFGNNIRGVKCLERLIEDQFDITAVVGHSNNKSDKINVIDIAEKNNIEYLAPDTVNSTDFINKIESLNPDICVFSGYSKIIKKELIKVPPLGCINLHGGKLPQFRGASPLNWQIINDCKEIGISIIYLDEGIDSGDIINEKTFSIDRNQNITEILDITLNLFPDMLVNTLNMIKDGTVKRKKQDDFIAGYFTKRYPRDGLIDWKNMTALQIHNLVRALTPPYPGAFTYYYGQKVIIHKTRLLAENIYGPAGRLALYRDSGIIVIASDKGLLIEKIIDKNDDIVDAKTILKIGNDFE